MFIKTSRPTGYALREPPPGTIETPRALFVPVRVGAGEKTKAELAMTRPIVRSLTIDSDLSTTVLELFLASGNAPKELTGPIEQLLKLKARLNEISGESSRLSQQHQTLAADQDRLRDNINLLRKTSGNGELLQSLVKKLAGIEDQLGVLSGKLVRLSEEQAGLESRLRASIAGITLEAR